jgi:hypothetical protein
LLSLLYMQAQCPGEASDVVSKAAAHELHRLCVSLNTLQSLKLSNEGNDMSAEGFSTYVTSGISKANQASQASLIDSLMSTHFLVLLKAVCYPELQQQQLLERSTWDGLPALQWTAGNPSKCAFDVLVRSSIRSTWKNHDVIMQKILIPQVQPKARPSEGSAEAIQTSYAAQRGEEAIPTLSEVDIRLSLLLLVEEIIRFGTSDWECGQYITQAYDPLFQFILIPNLIWHVGRVEATIRKVSLTICYHLLSAGALSPQHLYNIAPKLIPLIASHLDDSESTPRVMSCCCLKVFFERLPRGTFGESTISELYPKLLKRLDDSNDEIRIAICSTLLYFFQCASANSYSSTLLDYTLDQLFIHLDDSNESIQSAVEPVIVQIAKIDKNLVEKKCESKRLTHRSPFRCDKLLEEVRGYRILEDA